MKVNDINIFSYCPKGYVYRSEESDLEKFSVGKLPDPQVPINKMDTSILSAILKLYD